MSAVTVETSQDTSGRNHDPLCSVAEIQNCDFSRVPVRTLTIERQRSFDERSISELSIGLSPGHSSRATEHFRLVDHLDNILSPGRKSGGTTPNSEDFFEPHPIVAEAWEALQRSLIYFRGQPVGTIGALDQSEEALNYNQVSSFLCNEREMLHTL